ADPPTVLVRVPARAAAHALRHLVARRPERTDDARHGREGGTREGAARRTVLHTTAARARSHALSREPRAHRHARAVARREGRAGPPRLRLRRHAGAGERLLED